MATAKNNAPVLRSYIIPALKGTKRAMHVFVPAMRHRQATEGSLLPSVCLRSSATGFMGMKVFEKVEVLGPSSLEMVDQPLHGTGGRAQVLLLTDQAIQVWTYLPGDAPLIATPEGATPETILAEVIANYEVGRTLVEKF